MMNRAIMREVRRQHFIKLRLAEAAARSGPTLPARVSVTLEQLQEIKEQLEAHLAKTGITTVPAGTKLN